MTLGISNVTYCRIIIWLVDITQDKIDFLQEQKDKFSIEDFSLILATPVVNLTPNADVKCKIVRKKPGLDIPTMKVSLLKDGKEVHKIPQSDLPLFSLPVLEPGDYEVHAMLQGRHVPGSPLSLPVSTKMAGIQIESRRKRVTRAKRKLRAAEQGVDQIIKMREVDLTPMDESLRLQRGKVEAAKEKLMKEKEELESARMEEEASNYEIKIRLPLHSDAQGLH